MNREFVTGQIDKAISRFAGNNSGNAPVLMMLGTFKFSLNTAVFAEVVRSTAYTWGAQARVGQLAALQFTGPGDDTVTLGGDIFPDFRGGTGQIEDLRRMAAEGKPLRLVNAAGKVLGMWVIDKVDETASNFLADGAPRKQSFKLSMKRFAHADV